VTRRGSRSRGVKPARAHCAGCDRDVVAGVPMTATTPVWIRCHECRTPLPGRISDTDRTTQHGGGAGA
jgi:hypothetical protein